MHQEVKLIGLLIAALIWTASGRHPTKQFQPNQRAGVNLRRPLRQPGASQQWRYGQQWATSKRPPVYSSVTKYCCEEPDISHGNYWTISSRSSGLFAETNCDYNAGTQIEVVCDNGYNLKGDSSSSRCESNGQWIPNVASCQRSNCSIPYDISSVLMSDGHVFQPAAQISAGTVLMLSCPLNYQITGGPRVMRCDGPDWDSPDFPTCTPITCPTPVISNGVFSNTALNNGFYYYGDVIQIICDEGYQVSGSSATKCNLRGFWLPKYGECVPCGKNGCRTTPRLIETTTSSTQQYTTATLPTPPAESFRYRGLSTKLPTRKPFQSVYILTAKPSSLHRHLLSPSTMMMEATARTRTWTTITEPTATAPMVPKFSHQLIVSGTYRKEAGTVACIFALIIHILVLH